MHLYISCARKITVHPQRLFGWGVGVEEKPALLVYLFKSAYVVETWHSTVTVYISKRKTQSLGCSSGTATLTYPYLMKVSIAQ